MRPDMPLEASDVAHNPRPAPTRDASSYLSLFGLAGFPQLALGTLLGRTAGQFWQIALILFVLQRFHSPALAGFATFAAVVPGLVLSPLAGALLDRYRRLRLIQLDFAIAAATLALLAGLSLERRLSPDLLLVIVAVGSLTGPLSLSGTRSLFPLMVPRALWDRANAVDSGTAALAMVVGPALAGFCVGWFGGEGAFLVTAGIFVAAGLAVLGLREPATAPPTREPLVRSAWQALVYVVRHRTLRGIVITLWMSNLPYGMLSVALPVLVLRGGSGGASTVGVLWAVAGIATVVAGALVGRINSEGRERPMIVAGMAAAVLGFALALAFVLGLAPTPPVLAPALAGTPLAQVPLALLGTMVLLGLAGAPIDLGLFALRQRRTDPRWFGRVFAVSMSLNFAGVPVGSALAGLVLERSLPLALLLGVVVALAGCVVPYLVIPRQG